MFGNFILKENSGDSSKDPYDTKFYNRFVSVLRGLIKYKVITIVSVVCLFLVSMYIMGIMPQNFFPSMDKPYFRQIGFPAGRVQYSGIGGYDVGY